MSELNHAAVPVEPLHPSHFILDEMFERDLSFKQLAIAMGGPDCTVEDAQVNLLALQFYILLGPTDRALRVNAGLFATAFGTSPEFWTNLEAQWLAVPDLADTMRERVAAIQRETHFHERPEVIASGNVDLVRDLAAIDAMCEAILNPDFADEIGVEHTLKAAKS